MFGKKKKEEDKKVTKKDKVKFIKSLQEIYENIKGFNKVNIKEESNDNHSMNDSETNNNFFVYREFLIPKQKLLFESGSYIDNVKNIEITKIFKSIRLKTLLDEKKLDKEYLKELYSLFQSLYPYYLAKYGLNLEQENKIFIGPYMKYTNKNTIEIEKHYNASSQMIFAIQTHSYIPEKHGGKSFSSFKSLQSSDIVNKMKKTATKTAEEVATKKGYPASLGELKEQATKKAQEVAREQGLPGSRDELKEQAKKKAKAVAIEKGLPGSMDELKEQAKKKAKAVTREQGLPGSIEDVEQSLKGKLTKNNNNQEASVMDVQAYEVKNNNNNQEGNVMDVNADEVQHSKNTNQDNIDKDGVMSAEAIEVTEANAEIANNNELSENEPIEVSPEDVSVFEEEAVDSSSRSKPRQSKSFMSSMSPFSSSSSSPSSKQREIAELVRKHETEIQELKSVQQKAFQDDDDEVKLYTIHSFNSFNNLCTDRDGVLLVLFFLCMNHNQRISLIQGNFFKNGKPVNEVLQEFYEIYKDSTNTTEKKEDLNLRHYFGLNEKLDKQSKTEIRNIIKGTDKKPSLFKRLFGKKSKGGTKKKVRFSIKNKTRKDHLKIIKLKNKPKFTTKLYKNKNKLKMTRKNIK